jgi:polyisoprenoid-binding protein YceI
METATAVAAGTWTADLEYTRVTFAARHLLGSTVHGTIAVISGTVEVGDDGRARRLHAALDPGSIDTANPRRDSDLRGQRFLAVDAYPLMEVIADRITATAGGWLADAVLRGRGREAPLRVDATLESAATGPHLHVSATTRLDLRAAGIRVPGFLVRRFVEVSVSSRLTRQA